MMKHRQCIFFQCAWGPTPKRSRSAAPLRGASLRRLARAAGAALAVLVLLGACAKKQPPVARPTTPPPAAGDPSAPPAPPQPVAEPTPVPPEPIAEDTLASSDIDTINKNSPFQPVFFEFDSSEIESAGQQALNANAEILKKYPTWVITIEGHADERGTAEYNLALGERRAVAARTYLVSLGIPADRLRTVSYGKEFPFDPGHNEDAWAKNRRAQFVVTSK
jgi:peptidoglycan-associated lipoprotein